MILIATPLKPQDIETLNIDQCFQYILRIFQSYHIGRIRGPFLQLLPMKVLNFI